jgi:hypothetical protein
MNEVIETAAEKVREAWVAWAITQADPKPSWLIPWSELDETSKDADRAIARTLLGHFYRLPGVRLSMISPLEEWRRSQGFTRQ